MNRDTQNPQTFEELQQSGDKEFEQTHDKPYDTNCIAKREEGTCTLCLDVLTEHATNKQKNESKTKRKMIKTSCDMTLLTS